MSSSSTHRWMPGLSAGGGDSSTMTVEFEAIEDSDHLKRNKKKEATNNKKQRTE